MHQISLGGRAPRSPRPSSWIKGVYLKRREWKEGERRGRKGRG